MRIVLGTVGLVAALACLGPAAALPAAEEKGPPAGAVTFKMEEVSLIDGKTDVAGVVEMGAGGQVAQLTTTPSKKVKAYPKFNSPQPLYGVVILNREPEKQTGGERYYFALDQSPEALKAAKAEEKPTDEKAQKSGKGDKSDKGKKTKKTRKKSPSGAYDLLYFDGDHDLDLTNNPAIRPMKDAAKLGKRLGMEGGCLFDVVTAAIKEGTSVRLLPTVQIEGTDRWAVFMPASAWQGEIRLGAKAFRAMLVQPEGAVGRYDRPSTALHLVPLGDAKGPAQAFGIDALGMIREADGEFYTIAASPKGDRLYVCVVPGDRGLLQVSAGKRDVKELGLAGLLEQNESILQFGLSHRVSQYRLPVGKYQPMALEVTYGHLQVSLSENYRKARDAKSSGVLEIRKDQPYVLDFSEKAEMQFLSPAKEKVFKPGDTVSLAAMLAIPEKNLLVTGMVDTSRKIGKVKWRDDEGKEQTAPRYADLEPEVEITDAAGKKLGGGTMPFG